MLINAFIRYYCSRITQTALSRYYSAKRERSEHLCDCLNGLNGYARNARLQFEKGGRDAKEHVQQFLVTCGDNNMAESLYHTRVNDIHVLEEIVEDVLKGMARMTKRDGVTRHSRSRDSRRDEPHDHQSRRDRRESDRRRDDYRNTPRVTLAEVSLYDLLAELEGREATRSGAERSDSEHHTHEDDQYAYDHYQSDDASSDAAEGTYARSDNRPPRGNIPDRDRGFNQDRRSGEQTFNQDRRGGERSFNQDCRGGDRSFGQDSRGRRDFNATTGAHSMDLAQSAVG
ncbi:hypothetical protein PC123_g22864 [Phytophthora cactorum]|nr:hypothetical protein PC123_g22864 [Phytophthora cactorum]